MQKVHLLVFLINAVCLGTLPASGDTPKKYPRLEEMSSAELKEVLKKSRTENNSQDASSSAASRDKDRLNASLSEKRAYETSVQRRIDQLDYKIRRFEANPNTQWGWGFAQSDASRLKTIKYEAQAQLNRMRLNNSESWRHEQANLESLMRQASSYS